MAGEVLNMNDLTINNHRCKLKDLCSKNRHKTIYLNVKKIKLNNATFLINFASFIYRSCLKLK